MSIVNSLKRLKSNIFGGPGNTGFVKPFPDVRSISINSHRPGNSAFDRILIILAHCR